MQSYVSLKKDSDVDIHLDWSIFTLGNTLLNGIVDSLGKVVHLVGGGVGGLMGRRASHFPDRHVHTIRHLLIIFGTLMGLIA
jgi:hypothetical protein